MVRGNDHVLTSDHRVLRLGGCRGSRMEETVSTQPEPTSMQAVVGHRPQDYRLYEVDMPVPGPGSCSRTSRRRVSAPAA
jgi:hypothetical protein